ncbi:SGNH/GDSL hydrolase family protein [Terrisporobacter hibernicus]|uniref:SGNH/GDSL hydrolase family protein n=1 Tax=Terrisporobacter hibernicus TaxID=2813371 RepID=A0AAX2ZDI0_9FIRM|nr:SGNH/GDSL hydrolase family protein [Terrisporobacter hibernicus]UEL47364.1 SGNH/GDSL hydrolase family protein [Terrisporobacter hibernicus]
MSRLMYNKTNWKDDETTPINARNLNNLEDGIEYVYEKWDEIISDSTTGDHAAELIDARKNKKTLGERLDVIDTQFNTKANIDDITKLSTVTTEFANSIEEMTDTTVNYVNTTDGFLYRHNGSIFEKTTIKYQSTGLQDKSVTSVKLDSETSSRGYVWDKSPQSLGFNRAININYTIGQMNDNGTVNPSGSKARIYSDFFTVSNKKFTLYNKLNSIYKIGLITTDENGVKIGASSNFTGWMQENKFDWIITNDSVKKCYLNIARIDDAVMTDIDIDNLIKCIMICDGEYQITYDMRTYEGDNAYIFSPYPFRIDTVNKTISCDGTYKVAGGKKLMNNMPFDISNLDLSKQGTFYVDWENSVIKWCVAFDYTTKNMNTKNTSIIGHAWTLNSTYGTYLELFTNSDIYVDGVIQHNNGFSNRFKNKKFLFDGDSIMWGRTINGQTANPAIPDVVLRRLGVGFDKIAVSGACVTPKTPADGQSLVERCVNNDYANYQYIIMNGGTNDYGYERQIGTIDDTGINTFYGAWNTIIKTIYSKNPKAKVVLITPIYRSYVNVNGQPVYGNVYNIKNGAGYTLNDYSDAIVKIGELYNIPVLDSRKNSMVNILNYTTRLCHDGDNKYLHPNEDTYIDIGNIVASFIESKF